MVSDDHVGRTNCYHPGAHSSRRRTCKLLAPDAEWVNDFEPGLYLWGTSAFSSASARELVCTSTDMVMYSTEQVDTRREAPPPYSVAVLGPYVHPRTHRLVVKCVPAYVLDEGVDSLASLGYSFETMERDEDGVMVPSVPMMQAFMYAARNDPNCPYRFDAMRDIVYDQLRRQDDARHLGDTLLTDGRLALRQVREMLKNYFEAALYFRRWGGPGRPYPTNRVLPPVGDRGNPVSDRLRGRVLRGGVPADLVDPVEGRLINMEQRCLDRVLELYDALPPLVQYDVRVAMKLGTPFRMIDGSGYWFTTTDVYADGNPDDMAINLFDMCFGTRQNNKRKFVAAVSITGTRSYCVQVASIQILRSVLTLVPHLYRNVPTWARSDGEFTVTHT
jgi:hypothetical protein